MMLKIITGLTGAYSVANLAFLRFNTYLIKRGNLTTFKEFCRIPIAYTALTSCTSFPSLIYCWLAIFLNNDECSYQIINYPLDPFNEVIYANVENCLIKGYRFRDEAGISYWQSYAIEGDRYDIRYFSSPDECQKFVNDNKLTFNRNSYGLINVSVKSSPDEKIFVVYNDKQYTIATTLSKDGFYRHLAKFYQLPLNKLMLLIFVALVAYQSFSYYNKE